MLLIWNICHKYLFNLGIYRFIQTNIYFTARISIYAKHGETRLHATDTSATPNGRKMAVVDFDLSIAEHLPYKITLNQF